METLAYLVSILMWMLLGLVGLGFIHFFQENGQDALRTDQNTRRLQQRWKDAVTKANEERP